MKRQRNVFKKLLANVKMNGLSRDANGEFTLINSSTNKRRMNHQSGGYWSGTSGWMPSKIYITEQDLVDVWNKQNQVCYWFKIPLDFNLLFKNYPGYYPKHPLAPSVDRIDDKGDYTKDNILICCRLANLGRNIYPFEQFHDVVKIVKGEVKSNTLFD